MKLTKKTKNEPVNNALSTWFFKAPAKFSLLFVIGMVVLTLALALIAMPFGQPTPKLIQGVIVVAIIAFTVFCIYKLTKFTPRDGLDRKSFVGIDIGITAITLGLCVAIIVGLLSMFGFGSYQQFIMYIIFWLSMFSTTSPVMFAIVMFVFALIASYMMGLMISNYIIIFRRGREMGISKLKLWLSFPFGTRMIWFPEFFLPEDKKVKSVTAFKASWYSKLIDWVVAKPINSAITWAIMIGATVGMSLMFGGDLSNLYLDAFFLILFLAPLFVVGAAKLKKAMGGWFSTFAAAINILMIVSLIGYGVHLYNKTQNVQVIEESQYIEDDGGSVEYEDIEIVE